MAELLGDKLAPEQIVRIGQIINENGGIYTDADDENIQAVRQFFLDQGFFALAWGESQINIIPSEEGTQIEAIYTDLLEHADDPTYAVTIPGSGVEMIRFMNLFSNYLTQHGPKGVDGEPVYGVTQQGDIMWLSTPGSWGKMMTAKRVARK